MAGLGYGATRFLLSLAFRAGGSSGKTYPWFTNIGIIDDARLVFGNLRPKGAFMFGPVAGRASIVPVISTYDNALTICMGCSESDADVTLVESLLTSMVDQIAHAIA